jgi:hypothetical protein
MVVAAFIAVEVAVEVEVIAAVCRQFFIYLFPCIHNARRTGRRVKVRWFAQLLSGSFIEESGLKGDYCCILPQ